jgi:hypothetical protein
MRAIKCSSRFGGEVFGVQCELAIGHSGPHEGAGEMWGSPAAWRARSKQIEPVPGWCGTCGRVVPEGKEHCWRAHGTTEEQADELVAFKARLRATGAHHVVTA